MPRLSENARFGISVGAVVSVIGLATMLLNGSIDRLDGRLNSAIDRLDGRITTLDSKVDSNAKTLAGLSARISSSNSISQVSGTLPVDRDGIQRQLERIQLQLSGIESQLEQDRNSNSHNGK